jgi:hypothetical protein
MSLQLVRFGADPHIAPQLRSQLTSVCAALDAASASGVSYTAYVSESGTDFILALELADPAANPLVTLPEAMTLRDTIGRAVGGTVAPETFTIVGAYRS